MRILRYTYSKILNLFLRRFDSLISIADCTASKLYDVELTICATKHTSALSRLKASIIQCNQSRWFCVVQSMA